jgi:hypothetical protein
MPRLASVGFHFLPGPPQYIGPEYAVMECVEPSLPNTSWPPGIACAGVVVIYRSDGIGRFRHASSLTSPAEHDKSRGPLLRPSYVVSTLHGYMALLRLLPPRRLAFHLAAYSWAHGSCGLPTIGDLSCFCIRCDDIPLPIRRGVHRGCAPDSSPLPWPSPESKWFGSPFSVCRRCRISFMVRTAILHLLLGGILRFHTSSCPRA